MRNLFPIHQENNALFNCLFLNNLPSELRILLSKAGIGCLSQPVHHPPHKHSHNGGGGRWWPLFISRSRKERRTVGTVSPEASSCQRDDGGGPTANGWRGKKKPIFGSGSGE
jgi:hypothetical protein